MRGGKEVCNGSPLRRYAPAGLPSPSRLRRATSPRGRGFGMSVRSMLDERSTIWRKRAGLATEGSSFWTSAPCQAVAGLDSGALLFPRHRALLVQTKADRHANGSPFGGAGERSETERASPGQKSFCAAISRFFVRAILSLCKSCLAASLPSPSPSVTPLPKGEALAGRVTFHWTTEARQDAKGRASLTGPAASGQRTLSSCRESWQQRTTVPEISCFARPA